MTVGDNDNDNGNAMAMTMKMEYPADNMTGQDSDRTGYDRTG